MGRMKEKETIYAEIGSLTANYTTKEFTTLCLSINLSVSPVNSIKDVASLDFISKEMLKTKMPNGKTVSLFPSSMATDYLKSKDNMLSCAPRLGEQNGKVLSEAGFSEEEQAKLVETQVI